MAIGFHRTPEKFAESSGELHERFLLGAVRTGDPNYVREKNALIQHYRDLKQAVPLDKALEVVKRFQPFKPDSREPVDPASPTKQFPYALRKFVVEKLGLKGAKEKDALFWTTVGSLVDTAFGADAVIEVKGEKGEPSRLVRLDVTLRSPEESGKEENRDRVIIYGEIPDPHFDKKAYDEKIHEVGGEIIEKLQPQNKIAAERAA